MVRTAPAPLFVGRQEQLASLQQHLEEALSGRPQLVFVAGEPGIGKTALVKTFQSMAEGSSVQVFASRCYEDLVVPYLPFIDGVLARLPQVLGDVEHALGPAARIIDKLLHRDVLAGAISGAAGAARMEHEQRALFQAVAVAILAVARRRPTLLVLDDLHWADRASIDLLRHVVFAVSDAAPHEALPLMLLCTHRPLAPETPLARTLESIKPENIFHQLELTGLDDFELDELLQARHGGRPTLQLIGKISEVTHGNPLFVCEAVQHLIEAGALAERGGQLITTVSTADLRFPEHVTGAIAARAQGLSATAQSALNAASILGSDFTLALLSAITRRSEETLRSLIDEAIHQRLIVRESSGFRFAHPLIRHVFYNQIEPPQRRQIHYAAAQALAESDAESADEHVLVVAHHLLSAGAAAPSEDVARSARRAGDQALALLAWSDAARFYEAALATSDGHLAAGDRATLHHRAGLARYREMEAAACLEHYDHAIATYRAAGDLCGLAEVLKEKARAQLTLAAAPFGTLIDTEPLQEVARELADRQPALSGSVLAILAQAYWAARQPDKAEQFARQALQIGHELGDDLLCVATATGLALAQLQRFEVREALQTWRHGLVCARRLTDPWVQGWPLHRLPLALVWMGELDEAQDIALEAVDLTRRTSDWAEHSLSSTSLATIALARGDFAGTEQHARDAMTMVQRSRYPWGGPLLLPGLACARALRGAWDEAQDAIDVLVTPGRVFEEPGGPAQFLAWMYTELIRLHAGSTSHEALRQFGTTLLGALAGRDPDINSLGAFCILIEVADTLGAAELAEPAYRVLSMATHRGVNLSNGWVAMIARLLGVAAATCGRRDTAETHFETAVTAALRMGARPELGRTYLAYAQALARQDANHHTRAAALLQEAAAIFDELEMEPFLRQVKKVAHRFDLPLSLPSAQRPAGTNPLNWRELEVLARIARGRTDHDIAAELVLAVPTVARYASDILQKIGVDGRAAAAAYALRKGLLVRDRPPLPRAAPSGEERLSLPAAQPITILFTDMEGYTALIQRVGDRRSQEVLRLHNAIIRRRLLDHGGHEIKHTGDGINASFTSAGAAVECAIAMQRDFDEHNRAHPDAAVRVRIGLNAGEPIAEEGQLFGAAVNAAARICAQAQPGQILISEVVRQLTADKRFTLRDGGRVVLKGFADSFQLYDVTYAIDAM